MKLRYAPEALKNIADLRQYIGETLANPTAAERIAASIMHSCSRLKFFPESGFSLQARTGYDTDLRVLVCGNYLAVYRIENGCITVVRVINGRQDYLADLLDM